MYVSKTVFLLFFILFRDGYFLIALSMYLCYQDFFLAGPVPAPFGTEKRGLSIFASCE